MNNCKALLLDLNINSMETALLNIYQNFLACAIKFHCHIQALPKAGRVGHNPTFFFGEWASPATDYSYMPPLSVRSHQGNSFLCTYADQISYKQGKGRQALAKSAHTSHQLVGPQACCISIITYVSIGLVSRPSIESYREKSRATGSSCHCWLKS